MNEVESIASVSQALSWELLMYYREHGSSVVVIYVISCCLPAPHFHLQTNKLVLQTTQTSCFSWFRGWHPGSPVDFCLAHLWPTLPPHHWLGMGLLRQLWQPEFLVQWQSSLERTKRQSLPMVAPELLGQLHMMPGLWKAMLRTAQHLFTSFWLSAPP